MKPKDLQTLGIPPGPPVKLCLQLIKQAGLKRPELEARLQSILADPVASQSDPQFGALASLLIETPKPAVAYRDPPAPWKQWGQDLEEQAVNQMRNACRLPVSVAGALMPDAHVGYGLPIGGVLATEGAVIPYAVGVDIACRMKLTVFDLPAETIESEGDRLARILERETRFGVGATFKRPEQHPVMDADWGVTPLTRSLKDKAWNQLGTSGSGNHFVEFGVLKLAQRELGMTPGRYLAVLSHSGSRGSGASVAAHYSRLARDLHPELPNELQHLAWLDLDSEPGAEYWAAMELMGQYAAANHAVIHSKLIRALGAEVLTQVENHHNFAWKEQHLGRELIVHRKGATPAQVGVLGVIPGSMASPAYVVRGRGVAESLHSASHGAGRVMSRTAALKKFRWKDVRGVLEEAGVTLLSSGLDEVPMVYKDIRKVMQDQEDLVNIVASFSPRIVKMAPAGERAED